jgi:serine/threonine protein kinase
MRPPRVLLASRYEIVTPISGLQSSRCFFGFDTTAGRSVVVRLTMPPQSRWLAASRGASHRYLASVIDVVDNPDVQAFPEAPPFAKGTVAVVAEALRGASLHGHLGEGRLGLDRSVAWVLRVAEAVRCLHSRGAAHGAISTFSILAAARGRAIPPVLTQLVTPQLGTFASPERLTGEGPSLTDDLWALGVLLHLLISGELPFRGAHSRQ